MSPSSHLLFVNSPAVENHGAVLKVLVIFLPILTAVVVTARIFTRLRLIRILGADDILAILAYGLAISLSALVYIANDRYYVGHHIWNIPPSAFKGAKHNLLSSEVVYTFSSCLIKVSVLAFYQRLATKSTRLFRWGIYGGIALNIVFAMVFLLWLYFMCQPPEAFWMQFDTEWLVSHPDWKCYSDNIAVPVCAFFSTGLDLYAALLPLLLIRQIQITFKQKLALYGLFAFGYLVVIFGFIRAGLIWEAMNGSSDLTWNLYECWLWTILELYCAIIAASIPALRPLFTHIATSRHTTLQSSTPSQNLSVRSIPLSTGLKSVPTPRSQRHEVV